MVSVTIIMTFNLLWFSMTGNEDRLPSINGNLLGIFWFLFSSQKHKQTSLCWQQAPLVQEIHLSDSFLNSQEFFKSFLISFLSYMTSESSESSVFCGPNKQSLISIVIFKFRLEIKNDFVSLIEKLSLPFARETEIENHNMTWDLKLRVDLNHEVTHMIFKSSCNPWGFLTLMPGYLKEIAICH